MSTISGSCGISEAQLLFERGIQEQQQLQAQQNRALDVATAAGESGQGSSLSVILAEPQRVAEANKGEYIDVYV